MNNEIYFIPVEAQTQVVEAGLAGLDEVLNTLEDVRDQVSSLLHLIHSIDGKAQRSILRVQSLYSEFATQLGPSPPTTPVTATAPSAPWNSPRISDQPSNDEKQVVEDTGTDIEEESDEGEITEDEKE